MRSGYPPKLSYIFNPTCSIYTFTDSACSIYTFTDSACAISIFTDSACAIYTFTDSACSINNATRANDHFSCGDGTLGASYIVRIFTQLLCYHRSICRWHSCGRALHVLPLQAKFTVFSKNRGHHVAVCALNPLGPNKKDK